MNQDESRIETNLSAAYFDWRYGADFLGYRVLEAEGLVVVARARKRGLTNELVVLEASGGPPPKSGLLHSEALRALGLSHTLSLGPSEPLKGVFAVPRSRALTWRTLASNWGPSVSDLHLRMGDIELF